MRASRSKSACVDKLPTRCERAHAWVQLPEKGPRVPVRVLCYRLPEEQAKKARERKEAKLKKKHGRKYNKELVWWASWVIGVAYGR